MDMANPAILEKSVKKLKKISTLLSIYSLLLAIKLIREFNKPRLIAIFLEGKYAYTEKILTFSSELKMFLIIERHF